MQELIKTIEKITECSQLLIDDIILDKWDSLKQMSLIINIENEYGIKFTLKQISSMVTIRDICEAVNECQENNKNRS